MKPNTVYTSGTRGLHLVGAIGNVLVLAGFLFVGLGSMSVLLKLAAVVAVLFLAFLSDESPRAFLRSLRFVSFFAFILFLAQTLSIRDGRTMFTVGIPITKDGLLAGAGMSLRFLVILTSSFLFVTVTDPDRLAHLFIRAGLPYRYGYALILALRFVPFFRSELKTVREAQRMRGIRTSIRSLTGIRRAVRYTFIPVLVSGLMRVDSITMSMKGRGFGLHPRRTMAPSDRWTWRDAAAALWSAAWIGATVLARRLTWP